MAERITGHTELIGLMAYPIRHSSSPAMQNEAFAKLGYDYAYLAFEVGADEIEDAVKAIRTLKMRGSNVSMPNKTLVGKYLDELSPAAELCGAVNTIVNDNGHLTGHITDGIGFMSALKDNDIDVIGKKITIVGAGGAATAIEIQAALDGVAEITIFNRKDEFWDRAVSTVEKINTKTSCHAVLYDLADLDKLKAETISLDASFFKCKKFNSFVKLSSVICFRFNSEKINLSPISGLNTSAMSKLKENRLTPGSCK